MTGQQLFAIPKLEECRKLLCIQPHPDDIDLGAGGTISYLADRGAHITYLTVTDDVAGFNEMNISRCKRKEIRRREQVAAGNILGVREYHWLDFPDAGRWSEYEARNRIIGFIRMLKPDFVMTVDPWLSYEAHRDHIKCGLAVSEAVILSGMPYVRARSLRHRKFAPHEINGLVFCFTCRPNIVIDTGKHREKKLAAVARHVSQFDQAVLQAFEAYDRRIGEESAEPYSFSYGEAFKVLPPAMLHVFPEAERA